MKIINPALWKQLQDINNKIKDIEPPMLIVMVGLPAAANHLSQNSSQKLMMI